MTPRTALVTGASQGLGRAIALALAEEGHHVIAGARQVDKLETLVVEIEGNGRSAEAIALDVRDAASVNAMAAAHGKRIGILVNNAGITADGLAMRMKDDAWQRVLDTNLTGSFRCARAVLRGMVRSRWGRIINVTSVAGLSGNVGQANYSASKAGLVGMTRSLALELATRGITVNAVAPGFVRTEMTDQMNPATLERMVASVPMGRMGEAKEMAAAVCYLASENAGYVTGHVLNVSGGLYMG